MEQHTVVDSLSDRSADSFAEWLTAHPGAAIISRDHGGEYAEGAKRGAPNAIQVADRFHLLRNAGNVTRRVLQRQSSLAQLVLAPGAMRLELTRCRLDREASKQRTREMMREPFQQIHALAAEGLSEKAIARQLDLKRQTVYKYLALSVPPERRLIWRLGNAIAPYEGYVLRSWAQGCRNGKALWREIGAKGTRAHIRTWRGS
jgi:transposase